MGGLGKKVEEVKKDEGKKNEKKLLIE